MHNEEKCKNKLCKSEKCILRHPKECRFMKTFQNCKFGIFCAYEHAVGQNENNNEDLGLMKVKGIKLENESKALTEVIGNIKIKKWWKE